MPQKRLSLKARAMVWLAQREHSRTELRRKLLRVARAEAAERAAAGGSAAAVPREPADAQTQEAAGCGDPAMCVDRLLDWLQAHGLMSDERFAESRVHARSARFGSLRIQQELAQHGVALDADVAQQLRCTELSRAQEICRRKFGHEAPSDPRERARRLRFLAGRGFPAEVAWQAVRGETED
jgi:regulatory protein